MEENSKLTDDRVKFWRQCLKQALKSNDVMYAIHCDEMIVKLKKEK
jgi:hypothetical protein